MSATRDQSQKFTFVYSNLYHLYKKGQTAAKEAVVPESPAVAVPSTLASLAKARPEPGLERAKILKSEDLRQQNVRVERHEPPRLTAKNLNLHRPLKSQAFRAEAVEGLRDNLKTLQGLHERLRFMLKELEEITGSKKS